MSNEKTPKMSGNKFLPWALQLYATTCLGSKFSRTVSSILKLSRWPLSFSIRTKWLDSGTSTLLFKDLLICFENETWVTKIALYPVRSSYDFVYTAYSKFCLKYVVWNGVIIKGQLLNGCHGGLLN